MEDQRTALDYDLPLLLEEIYDAPLDDWEEVDPHHEELYLEEVVPPDIRDPRIQIGMVAEYFGYELTGDFAYDWDHIKELADQISEDLAVLLAEFGYNGGMVLGFYGDNNQEGDIPGSPYCLWAVRSKEPLAGEVARDTVKTAQDEEFSLKNYTPSDEDLDVMARMMVIGLAAGLVRQGKGDKKTLSSLKPADAAAILPNLARAVGQQREAFKNEIVVLKRYGADGYLDRRAREIKSLS